ncbi:predicted protein [Naegleria gruberi]|uniref:Predicted protein n=1 Tax=Naegleria gruberi TaxID=5762 RepID=D2VP56_NAEGR|nr:uncharacterized protein NAEGRDRAFT_70738 [Naegleria gruberi]EFC41373.1 predicted protein [Naegleria gruberi]|eukprot:XP_002674117.1 predicted protein [Naegleria gruberi strain NEG-M]
MLWLIFYIDIILTILTFLGSIYYNNSSIYDPYWSIFPPFAILLLFIDYFCSDRFISRIYMNYLGQDTSQLSNGSFSWVFLIMFMCLNVWAYRLTKNFFTRPDNDDSAGNILTKGQEDWRYRALRIKSLSYLGWFGIKIENNSRWNIPYWIISFLGIHLFPTLIVFFAMIPLFATFFNSNQIAEHSMTFVQLLSFISSALFSLFCVWISHAADVTLHRHLATRTNNRQVLVEGVWAYTRHGNYFGEVGFWWSIFLFACSLQNSQIDQSFIYFIWGPILVTCLFQFISVPWVERKMSETKPLFSLYQKQVSVMIPWFHSKDFSKQKYSE